jgi:alkylation response protein AidB-like acyl-CoA dehydrogenase
MRYAPPLADFAFLLHDVFAVQDTDLPGYGELRPDFTAAVLEAAGKLAAGTLAPLNEVGDREGCRLVGGEVRTPAGFQSAYAAVAEGGWIGLDLHPDFGGQGLPHVLNTAVGEMHAGANMALNMYWGLSHGAYNAIARHASAALKAIYLPPLVSGRWAGTMNLTEPQCGTDLGLLRARAEPQADGAYRISGQKIFISSGDHDLTENILHLVLARLPDAPAGVKGISLFLVPKVLVNDDGSLGARNAVSCGKLERKMGIHGNATCVMNYDGATGHLVGEPHKGLRAMFTMMNEARLAVGVQGLAVACAAYQQAAAYARERLQGRAAGGPAEPGRPADPIIVHADVRRMLMDQRSFVEGARALALWTSTLIDRHRGGDAGAHGLVSLLTPVVKAFLTDRGFEATVQAQQVFGGHGYTEDWPMSQLVRDARIAMIYEGANGVQALDLVARKLGSDGGAHFVGFLGEARRFVRDNAGDAALGEGFLDPLAAALSDLEAGATFFMERGMRNPSDALAGSNDFLHLFGHAALGLMWARMGKAALAGESAFRAAKLATGRHYMTRQLPATALHLARIRAGAETVMALPAEAF